MWVMLDWWKNHDEHFRYFSTAAKNVLYLSITNASNARNFSIAGLVVLAHHLTSLSSESADCILFLHNSMQ
jgi:hypothetical protein